MESGKGWEDQLYSVTYYDGPSNSAIAFSSRCFLFGRLPAWWLPLARKLANRKSSAKWLPA